jgi:prepilin-type N-terminal cleavage/methylation domain-containing protein
MNFKRHRAGFTLIELLVVIAIIAILAAILYPVFSRVRESVRQSSCFTNMHNIYVATKLYREDNNRYPASLLGSAQYLDGNNKAQFYSGSTGQPLPAANLIVGQVQVSGQAVNFSAYEPLFNGQKYLKDINVFTCPDISNQDKNQNQPPVAAVYPANVGCSGPVTYTAIVQHNTGNDTNASYPLGKPVYFYTYDSYDIGPQLDASGAAVQNTHEAHYSLDWTCNSGSTDPKNQLKYGTNAPDDSTVLTWCTEHTNSGKVLVVMASGKTITADAKTFFSKGPLNFVLPY